MSASPGPSTLEINPHSSQSVIEVSAIAEKPAAQLGAAPSSHSTNSHSTNSEGSTYRWLLGLPGTKPMMVAGLLARLPISMVGIGGMVLVAATTGSYRLAGATTAVVALAGAAAGPLVGRRIDQRGPRAVLPALAGVHVVAGVAFLFAALTGAPVTLLLAAAAATGATLPQVGPVARQRWASRFRSGRQLDTAYALESALDEVSFVTGPAAASALAGLTPSAGVAAALLFAAAGTAAFTALPTAAAPATTPTSLPPQPPTTPAPPSSAPGSASRSRSRRERSVLRSPGVPPVLAAAVALGMFFGTMDIGLIAYARAHGWGGAAGLLPSLVTASSLAAGITYGTIRWRTGLVRRYGTAACLLAAGTALVPLAGWAQGIGAVTVAVTLAGLPIAPLIITGTAIVGELVPAHRRTEGFSWMVIANGLGIAVGAPLGGAVVDQLGADWALPALATCGCLTATAALVAAGRLARQRCHYSFDPAALDHLIQD